MCCDWAKCRVKYLQVTKCCEISFAFRFVFSAGSVNKFKIILFLSKMLKIMLANDFTADKQRTRVHERFFNTFFFFHFAPSALSLARPLQSIGFALHSLRIQYTHTNAQWTHLHTVHTHLCSVRCMCLLDSPIAHTLAFFRSAFIHLAILLTLSSFVFTIRTGTRC